MGEVMGILWLEDRIMAVADEYTEQEQRSKRKPKLGRKKVGAIGELEFIQQAIRKGFRVSKPWGERDPYDAITDWNGTLCRVQVKATERLSKDQGYMVHATSYVDNKIVGLTKEQIDVLAAYLAPENAWYIVPVEHFVPLRGLWFSPGSKIAKFEKFREAWHWLKSRTDKRRRRRTGRK